MADFPLSRDNTEPELWLPSEIPPHHLSPSFANSLPFFPQSNHNFSRAPPNFPPKPQFASQGLIPAAGYGSIHRPPTTPSLITNSSNPYDFAYSGYGPYGYQCLTPQPKVNGFLELQWHQNHVLPFQPSVFGPVSRGTGVFHPQVINDRSRKKRSGRRKKKEEVGVSGESSRNSSKGEGKQKECPQHLPYEMALPNEWTY